MAYKKLYLAVFLAAVLLFSFSGGAWAAGSFELVLGYQYPAAKLYISPYTGLAFAYASGGLKISTDRGKTWSELNIEQFNDLAFEPGGIFLLSGVPPKSSGNTMSLYSSADDGSDFDAVAPPFSTSVAVPVILVNAGSKLLGNFGGGIEVSTDGGQTWTGTITYGVVPEKGCLAAADGGKYFAIMNDNSLEVTGDGGQTWANTGIKLGTAPMVASYADGEFLYGRVAAVPGFAVALSPSGSALLYISRDDGKSWKKIDSASFVISKGGQSETAYCAAVAPGGLAFAGTAHGVLVSSDYGQTWKPAAGNFMGEVIDIACSQMGKKVIVLASAKGVYRLEYDRPAAQTSAPNMVKFVLGQKSYSVNGKVYAVDTASFLDSSKRVLVPVRFLGDALGVKTTWDKTARTVVLTKGKTTIKLVIGSKKIIVNGKINTLDVAPAIRNGRAFLPARYVAQAIGYTVSWDDKTKTVIIRQNLQGNH